MEQQGTETGRAVSIEISSLWAKVITGVLTALLVASITGAVSVWSRVGSLEEKTEALREVVREQQAKTERNRDRFDSVPTYRDLQAAQALSQQQYQEIIGRLDRIEGRLHGQGR